MNTQATRPDDPHATLREALPTLVPALRGRALKLCRNATEAQDLVQDTLERALRFEGSFRAGTNARAWVQQILFSVFISKCRRRTRERRAMETLTVDPNAWTAPEPVPTCTALGPGLERALDELPAQFAVALRLVDLAELSYKEAAEQLEVPVGTVMSRLFRGRRLLAARLGPQQGEQPTTQGTTAGSLEAPAQTTAVAA